MALTTATVTFDISDQLGNDFDPRRTKIWLTTNVPGDTVIDKAANKIRLGSGNVTLNADGTGSIVVWVPGADANPASWQTTIHVDYPDRNADKGRGVKSFGPFTITANADLADLVAEMPVQPEYAMQFLDRIDGINDRGDVSGAVDIDPAIAMHVLDATAATTLTIGDPPGNTVSILVISGAADVTLDGSDHEFVDGSWVTLVYVRGSWTVAASSGGEPAVTDSTPPTAVTDLTATGGEGQVVLDWSAAADAESTTRYRYRVWLTSGGATGTWTTTTDTAATVAGLAAGAYTAEVYSYSNGGQTTPDTATATVTAPAVYTEWDRHEFNAANSTLLSTLPTVNGRTYNGTSSAAVIHDNKLAPNYYTGGSANTIEGLYLQPPAADKVRQTWAYDVSNAAIGYRCYVIPYVFLTQTGSLSFWLQANAAESPTGSEIVSVGGNSTGVTPSITYESGKSSTGHPVTGTLTVEIDTLTDRVNILINDVAIGFIDCSAFTYSGNPNPPKTTMAYFDVGNRCKIDRHVIEVLG